MELIAAAIAFFLFLIFVVLCLIGIELEKRDKK